MPPPGTPLPLSARVLRKLRKIAREAYVPARWIKWPGDLAGRDVCLFVTYNPRGRIAEHALVHARAWAAQGFAVILVVSLDRMAAFDPTQDLSFCAGVLARGNVGYDFGAWAATIRKLRYLRGANLLAIANDSIYGPFEGFAAMLARMRASSADVVGVTESHEIRWHLQSFILFFKGTALASPVFKDFWKKVRGGDRQKVIDTCELALAERMVDAGLAVEGLFRPPPGFILNPSLQRWRPLIEEGFPYLKGQLLRDESFAEELADWREVVRAKGFDPALIEAHLAAR
jgi:lipopolysaccharide biosynthesis protein